MAKTKKTEGQKVREAMDGPSVEHDQLINHMLDRKREKYARKSDASESGAKVSELLDETGLNSKAYNWGSQILGVLDKKDGQAKAMDIIRSLKVVLPMLESHVGGQSTTDMFDGKPPADAANEAETGSEEKPEEKSDGNTITPIEFVGDAG